MTGQDVVSSAVKPRRGGRLSPSARPAGLPPVPVGPAPDLLPGETDVELLGLSVVNTVFDRFTPAERRRALAFLADRYGEARP